MKSTFLEKEMFVSELIMRLAMEHDLPDVKEMYQRIVDDMIARKLVIWDDVYPVCCLAEDIAQQRLYVFEKNSEIVAACVLSDEPSFSHELRWQVDVEPTTYIDRLGVSADHARQGIGTDVLGHIDEWSRLRGSYSVRLFVAVDNKPAIELYRKCGFKQVSGVHLEVFDDDSSLEEIGFEKLLTPLL